MSQLQAARGSGRAPRPGRLGVAAGATVRVQLRPRVCQAVLHSRVRQAESVGGGLLRFGDQDGRDHADLAVGGASGRAGRPSRHALRTNSKGSAGSASRMVIGCGTAGSTPLAPTTTHRTSEGDSGHSGHHGTVVGQRALSWSGGSRTSSARNRQECVPHLVERHLAALSACRTSRSDNLGALARWSPPPVFAAEPRPRAADGLCRCPQIPGQDFRTFQTRPDQRI